MTNRRDLPDRELLIRIDERTENLVTEGRDHEARIRRLERLLWVGLPLLALASGNDVATAITRLIA